MIIGRRKTFNSSPKPITAFLYPSAAESYRLRRKRLGKGGARRWLSHKHSITRCHEVLQWVEDTSWQARSMIIPFVGRWFRWHLQLMIAEADDWVKNRNVYKIYDLTKFSPEDEFYHVFHFTKPIFHINYMVQLENCACSAWKLGPAWWKVW